MLLSTNVTRTEPSTEPVTQTELAELLRIDYSDHDTMLIGYIKEARQVLETGYLWKAIFTQTCVDKFDEFADGMELHWQPVASITSITYLDTDGATQTLASSVYELGTDKGVGFVRLKYGQTFPATRSHPDVITVTYSAGYGATAGDVPEAIRQGVILYAGHLYDNPNDPPPSWVTQRIAPYIDPRATG